MKNTLRKTSAILTVVALCMTLSSCSIFKTMRENALEASMQTILESPDEKAVIEKLAAYADTSVEKALSANESVSYSVNDVQILAGEEEAGLLDDSAKQLRNFIMAGNPGSASRDITADDKGLLSLLGRSDMLSVTMDRNIGSERVTDDKGNVTVDEAGQELTTQFVSDNILHLTLNYFGTEVTETKTNEDSTTEEITSVIPAEEALVEEVFGKKADKEEVLKAFDATADYLKVNDYELSYTDCKISTDVSLDEELLNFVKFEKNMIVTAKVTGVGKLESYGDLTVTFRLTKTVNYGFTFAAEE